MAVIDVDEEEMGAALYGSGQRVRAALIDHKDAVIEVLERLASQAVEPDVGNTRHEGDAVRSD